MQKLAIVNRTSFDYLPAFGRVPEDSIPVGARMPCLFRRDLDFAFLDPLIEKHWAGHLDADAQSNPVLAMHVIWNEEDMAGLWAVSVCNGDIGMTSYTDDGMIHCPEPSHPVEARITRAFLSDLLMLAFVEDSNAFAKHLTAWREQINAWVGYVYSGNVAFFISLRDRSLVLVKDDEVYERVPALVVTDSDGSGHALVRAHDRVAHMPRDMRAWLPGGDRDGAVIRLFCE